MSDVDPRFLIICEAVRSSLEKHFPKRKTLRSCCSLSACAVVELCHARQIQADFVGGYFIALDHACTGTGKVAVVSVAAVSDLAGSKPIFGNLEHIALSRQTFRKEPHAWVRHRRNYVDLTLTQFDSKADRIAILDPSDPRYVGELESLNFARAALLVCGSGPRELQAIVESAEELIAAA